MFCVLGYQEFLLVVHNGVIVLNKNRNSPSKPYVYEPGVRVLEGINHPCEEQHGINKNVGEKVNVKPA